MADDQTTPPASDNGSSGADTSPAPESANAASDQLTDQAIDQPVLELVDAEPLVRPVVPLRPAFSVPRGAFFYEIMLRLFRLAARAETVEVDFTA